MTSRVVMSRDGRSITITMPLTFRKFGGRKEIVLPDDAGVQQRLSQEPNKTLRKALGRAFRWQRLLDNGTYSSIQDIAKREKIGAAFIGRILKLTLLAPDIVTAILDGKIRIEIEALKLSRRMSSDWTAQRNRFFALTNARSQ